MRQFIFVTLACIFLLAPVVNATNSDACRISNVNEHHNVYVRMGGEIVRLLNIGDGIRLKDAIINRVQQVVCEPYRKVIGWLERCTYIPRQYIPDIIGDLTECFDVLGEEVKICGNFISVSFSFLEDIC